MKTAIKLLDWQAEKAAQHLAETGQITVIVQDNHPIHKSKQVREHWSAWQEKGLFLFQLPKYSSQMNLIETEWHQIKTHELAGRIFEDESDLAPRFARPLRDRGNRRSRSTRSARAI